MTKVTSDENNKEAIRKVTSDGVETSDVEDKEAMQNDGMMEMEESSN